MKILDKGHKYKLKNLKTKNNQTLCFYKDGKINQSKTKKGTSNQEVLRVLIDRVLFMENQKHHYLNKKILKHLRKALVLHEMRHLDRKVDKLVNVENIYLGEDGHFKTIGIQQWYQHQN